MCLSSLPPDSGTLISKLNAKFTFIWKEGFGPMSNSPILFLFSSGKMLLTLFLFQKLLGRHFPEDIWAWLCLIVFSSLRSSLLCTFYYPISSFQSTLHLICFDTALFEEPHLSVMILCDLPSLWKVSMIVFSSPLFWFQRTRDTRNLYCMDGHLLKLKCRYSNILIYWIFDFHELKALII